MIDNRVHNRIIGLKGRSVRKIMEKFKVDIRFPRQENPNLVVISGDEESCEACKEHLQLLEEDYVRCFIFQEVYYLKKEVSYLNVIKFLAN